MKIKYFVYLSVALMLFSCKGKKTTPSQASPQGPGQPISEVFQLLSNTYTEWDDVQLPVTLTMQSPQKLSISGRATMVRDQSIYFSLKFPFVGEVAQIYANADSVWFVDKYHRMFLSESLSTLCGQYPMSLDDIQDCILGQAFPLDASGVTAEYNLVEQVPWLNGLYFERQDIDRKVVFQFAEMQETPAGLACDMVNIYAKTDSLSMQAQILWNLNKAQWNQSKNIDFKRPGSNYQQVSLQSLLKSVNIGQ